MPFELVVGDFRCGGAAGWHCFSGASGAPDSRRRGAGVLGLLHGGAPHIWGFRSPFGVVLRHVAELPSGEWAAPARRSPGPAGQSRPNKRATVRNGLRPTGAGHPQLLPNRRKNASPHPPERSPSTHPSSLKSRSDAAISTTNDFKIALGNPAHISA